MEQKMDLSIIQKTLDWSYDKALNGLPGTPTAQELGNNYLTKYHTVDKAISALINWQITKAGTVGFLTGLGGVITLPVSIPANLASVFYVQIRMVSAIATMRGYDIRDDQVKTLIFLSLTGQAATDILKETGIKVGTKMLEKTIEKKISGETIKAINKKVGFRLLTKFGEKGVINLGKLVPIAGGLIGGTADAIGTKTIGLVAKNKLFIEDNSIIIG